MLELGRSSFGFQEKKRKEEPHTFFSQPRRDDITASQKVHATPYDERTSASLMTSQRDDDSHDREQTRAARNGFPAPTGSLPL